MNDLSELTVVIPTINGHAYLSQTLEFWKKTNAKIIVLDASDKSFEGNLSSSAIYLHMPKSSYTNRMAIAVSLVKTNYVVMACDDELYVPSVLSDCLRILADEPEYVSAIGAAVSIESNGAFGFWGKQYSHLQSGAKQSDCDLSRVRSNFTNWGTRYYYSVTRSNPWKLVWGSISLGNYSPFEMPELQLEFALSCYGKIFLVPRVMWVRNRIENPRRAETVKVLDWWYGSEYSDEVKNFISQMTALLLEISKVRVIQSSTDPQVLVGNFIRIYETRQKRAATKTLFFRFANRALDGFPKLRNRLIGWLDSPKIPLSIHECLESGTDADTEILENMRRILLKVRNIEECIN